MTTNAKLSWRQPSIIPKPQYCTFHVGRFALGSQLQVFTTACFVDEITRWQRWFKLELNVTLVLDDVKWEDQATTTDSLSFAKAHVDGVPRLTVEKNTALGPEEYTLKVSQTAIGVAASSTAGVFYAFQTLIQLLPNAAFLDFKGGQVSWLLPLVEIKDSPRFSYRGMHLDVARRFMPVTFIKHFIDLLALHKINRFHWHLTDDQGWRIEIRAFPKLTEQGAWRNQTVVGHTLDGDFTGDGIAHGGYYSQEDVRDIVAYAQTKHVVVVPEIDLPGHATAFLHAYPNFGCTGNKPPVEESFGIFQHVLCPTEETFQALHTLFREIADLFPGDYIHLGGDEVVKTQWQQSPFVSELMKEHGWQSYDRVHHYFIKRVSDIIISLGKKPIGWNEVIEGGEIPDTTIMCWQNAQVGLDAAEAGYEVIMSPASSTYFDFYQSKSVDEPMSIHGLTSTSDVYHFQPIPAQHRDSPLKDHIIGIQGQLWSEYFTTLAQVEYMAIPRMTALAEVAWTQSEEKNWAEFSGRLKHLMQRFTYMGINVSESIYATDISSSLIGTGLSAQHQISLSAEIEDDITWYYSLDGSDPKYGQRVDKPLVLTGNTNLSVRAQDKTHGRWYPKSRFHTLNSKLVGARLSLRHCQVNREWNLAPEKTLVSGISRKLNCFHADEWAHFPTGEAQIEIDVMQAQTFSQVTLGYTPGLHRHFAPPRYVQLCQSNDGVCWSKVITAKEDNLLNDGSSVTLNVAEFTARYLKLIIKTEATTFQHQTMAYEVVPLMLDEIVAL